MWLKAQVRREYHSFNKFILSVLPFVFPETRAFAAYKKLAFPVANFEKSSSRVVHHERSINSIKFNQNNLKFIKSIVDHLLLLL